MKKVYLDFHGKKHSLYDNLINYPPDGYEFVNDVTKHDKFTKNVTKISFLPNLLMKTANNVVPINLVKPYLEKSLKVPSGTHFTYSAGHVVFKDAPWVVDLEFVTHLSGYRLSHFNRYKKLIEKYLKSDNCKKIMPWTDAGKKSVLLSFDSQIIHDKVETVHLAVPPKEFIKEHKTDSIKILFVGSQNLPRDFEIKGGKEVFETFKILKRKYKNIKLTVRSYVPESVKRKYSMVNDIKIIDKLIPWSVLENEFKTADIFLFPGHQTPGLALLDAMSYELPIVTTDVWANSEMVRHGQNGFLVPKSDKIRYYDENFIPCWFLKDSFKVIQKGTDSHVIKKLVDEISILIEDEYLRRKMGKRGRNDIEKGKFSIGNRNKKLKKIFDFEY